MMSVAEYSKKLSQFQKDLPKVLMIETMLTEGADIRATVTNRVITTGNKGSGGRFTPYKPKKDGSMGRYAELRRLHGLQVAFKDFQFTKQMWDSFNVLRDECKLFKSGFMVRLGGTNQRAQDIISGQSKYEEETIIDMTDAETQALAKRIDKIVLRKFKEYGL
jgi:hypothetical protein